MPVTTPTLYTYEYPRPSVTVDMILFAFQNDELTVLLIRRTHDPFAGKWALPGGFVGEEEDLYDAAQRELKEETNVSNVYLEQLYTFGQPYRDPWRASLRLPDFALLSADEVAQQMIHSGSDAGEARWWSIYSLPELAFDHDSYSRICLAAAALEARMDGARLLAAAQGIYPVRVTEGLRDGVERAARQAQFPPQDPVGRGA